MSEDQAPPVVAVVVASDPGPWFEACLEGLAAQDYPNLSTLVVDAASATSLAPRVAAVAPGAYLRRVGESRGYGPSANIVMETVEGAALYLFCHDDVVLAPDAIRRMVEEAFRSNAGVVAPKLLDYEEPERLLQLGLGVDRFGAPVRRVERGEFDRAQHDAVREVFAAPGGCTLVRADLFATIGGFDPEISLFGEDIDLCWRARLAGARVVVAPAAHVRHLEATASRQRPCPEARSLQWRHELRAVLKNYGSWRRALVVAQLLVLSLAEVGYFLAIGKRWRARQVLDAWRWNLSRERDLKGARAAVVATRRLPDRLVCRLFSHRTFRVWRFVRPALEDAAVRWSRSRHELAGALSSAGTSRQERRPRAVVLAVLVVILVIVVGSRSILSGHLPLVGQLLPIPGPEHLLARYLGGWQDAGLQRPGPASPAFAILGIAGIVLFGATGLLLTVELALAVVLGAVGIARLVRPLGPPGTGLVAAVAYLFLPLAWNDVARGDVQALIAYAGMPWVLGRLARASGLAPFSPAGGPAPLRSRRGIEECLALGVLVAVLGAFVPMIVLLMLACALALALGGVVAGEARRGLRVLVVAAGGAVVAFVLCFPWSLTFVQPGARWSVLSGAAGNPTSAPGLATLLRFGLGPTGRGILGWAFLVAAALVLLVGRSERLAWGIRWWVCGLALAALPFAASEGWLGAGGGALRVLLAPTAACIAACVGLGASAIAVDLSHAGFGWRQLAGVACGACALAGLLPVLGASLGGRWGLPDTGYDVVLPWTASASGPSEAAATRVLWLGDPTALPMPGWQLVPGLAAGVSSGGLPDATRLWPSANPGVGTALIRDVESAESGLTVRLGHLLAPSGIRYLVVPTAIAPELPGTQTAQAAPPPQVLLDGLTAQSDLHQLPSEGGALIFENAAWSAGHVTAAATGGGTPGWLRELGVAAALAAWAAALTALALREGRRSRRRAGHRSPSRAPSPAAPIDALVSPPAPERAEPAIPAGAT